MAVSGGRVDPSSRASSHSTVLVTGGTGILGSVITKRLLAEGMQTRVYSRHAGHRGLPSAIIPYTGDIRDAEFLFHAMMGVDAVVHLAGILRESGSLQTFAGVSHEGTIAVTQAARRAGVRRLIHLTGIGANRDSNEPLSRAKGLAEGVTQESGLDWTILRPSVIFGVRGGMFDRIAQALRRTYPFAIVPYRDGFFQPLWYDDAASCVVAALRDARTSGTVHELGGPDTLSYVDIVRLALRYMRIKRAILRLPAPLLVSAAFLPRLLGRQPFLTWTEMQQLTMDNRTDPSVMRTQFGIDPVSLHEKLNEAFPA